MNPGLGRNFEAMDPLEWLARLSDHIPDPGKHRVHFYGRYACRSRAAHQASEPLAKEGCQPEHAQPKRRCPPSWARLIHKVFQVDPLVCRRCGGRIKIVAYIHQTAAIQRILDHLGLAPPEAKPPPQTRHVVRVPVDDEGREIPTA